MFMQTAALDERSGCPVSTSVLPPRAPMHASPADVAPANPAVSRRRPRRRRIGVTLLRLTILTAAGTAVSHGVMWMRQETPHPDGAEASRQAPLVVVHSLKPLLETTHPTGLPAYGLKKESTAPKVKPAVPTDRFKALQQWPQEVALEGNPQVTVVAEDAHAHEFLYRTEHFEFSTDAPLGADAVRHFARAFEATHLLSCLLPLDLKPAPEPQRKLFQARILSNESAYAAATPAAGGASFYSSHDKRLYVPLSSVGVKLAEGGRVVLDPFVESHPTLIREIARQMMNKWLPLMPSWLAEGSAEYIGAADYVHGRFFMGQMQPRLKRYLRNHGARQTGGASVRLDMLNVAELLAMDAKSWTAGAATQNQASALLLTYFLCHMDRGGQGAAVIALLRALEGGMPQEDAVRQFVLAGRHPTKFEGEMGMAFARIGIELQFTRRGGAVFKQ